MWVATFICANLIWLWHTNLTWQIVFFESIKQIHHNLFITPLLWATAESLLANQPCCSQTRMCRLYRKWLFIFFYNIYTFLGSIFKPYCKPPCYNEQCYKEVCVCVCVCNWTVYLEHHGCWGWWEVKALAKMYFRIVLGHVAFDHNCLGCPLFSYQQHSLEI